MPATRLDPFDGRLAWVGECLEWTAGRFKSGYGQVGWRRKTWRAHRLAWTLANGPIPDGLDVLHSCDNPPCCLLGHLRLGTHAENMHDSALRKRQPNARKTHCVHGHRFTPENTIRNKDGWRRCRICALAAVHRYQARIASLPVPDARPKPA